MRTNSSVSFASNECGQGRSNFKPVSTFLKKFCSNYGGPYPVHHSVLMQVFDDTLDDFAGLVYDEICSRLFPSSNQTPTMIITRDNFILVIRYLFHGRIDHVYSNYCGKRNAYHIPLSSIEVPASLAICINNFGVRTVFDNSVVVCPKPSPPPEDKTEWLTSRVGHDVLDRFAAFVNSAKTMGVIRTIVVSRRIEGTSAWLLKLVNVTTGGPDCTLETSCIKVVSQFTEWTSVDGMVAICMNCTRYWRVRNCDDVFTALPPVFDVPGFRAGFATLA